MRELIVVLGIEIAQKSVNSWRPSQVRYLYKRLCCLFVRVSVIHVGSFRLGYLFSSLPGELTLSNDRPHTTDD